MKFGCTRQVFHISLNQYIQIYMICTVENHLAANFALQKNW